MPIKLIVAHNLAELRKAKGLTQGELAERFNYSDKSISKWEHGDTLPDIEVLKQLCDFYGVTLDYLVTEDEKAKRKFLKRPDRKANKWTIIALAISAAWLLGAVAFIAGQIFMGIATWAHIGWICFVWPIPASFIIWLVFNSLWGNAKMRTVLVILLTWSALASIYLTLGIFVSEGAGWRLWPIFLIGIPLTVAAILWNHVLARPKE
ncbi:MAG: helix-turn-helix domain-containing protein [Bacilli bacterium]|nr:helix-turn-helix domain-containing protein [Bacilli bacterium]